jgi:ferredoxin
MTATGQRLRRNSWGKYYVTDECDGCGVCASCAMLNFESSEDGSYYYVAQQPLEEAEEKAVRRAMAACPLGCIRADGD